MVILIDLVFQCIDLPSYSTGVVASDYYVLFLSLRQILEGPK